MPVHVRCPHCRTPCMVAEQYLGVPVKCGRCGRSFTTRSGAAAAPPRLDIAAAATPRVLTDTEKPFLTQHLVYWNLDVRQELAVLLLAGGPGLAAASVALAPLLAGFLNSVSQDAAAAAERLAAACKNPCASAVIWNGQVSIGSAGEVPLYHHSAGSLTRLRRGVVKLSAGDWLILASTGSSSAQDESVLQRKAAAAPPSAQALAEQLVTRGGSEIRDNDTVIVVRCY